MMRLKSLRLADATEIVNFKPFREMTNAPIKLHSEPACLDAFFLHRRTFFFL